MKGYDLAGERVQRRLAAILAMDMVGYSRQMGADEAGTLARLKVARRDLIDPVIAEHDGRIVKEVGDGLLVEFASTVAAVQSAAVIQEGLAASCASEAGDHQIAFRIGINVGDVIVDGEDIHGDGVNLAVRLEGAAAPGGICVSLAVHDQIKNKLHLQFKDLGEREFKNIAEPVRVFAVDPAAPSDATPSDRNTRVLDRPAIAVLPLVNMSADPEQEYFADGLTEDLITALSHWRLFPVIARNSVFTYKGRSVRVQQVAEELGARYVLEGSVRKAGGRIRITTQLIDADTGHHIWAEKFDREIEDIFAVQDEITRRIARTLQPELARAEERRAVAKTPSDLTAWDYVQRGLSLMSDDLTAANAARASQLYMKAIELDPDYSQAYSALTFAYHAEIMLGDVESAREAEARLLATGQRAVDLDKADSRAHLALGLGLKHIRRNDLAIRHLRKAIELNPSDPFAYMQLGSALDFVGQSLEALAVIERASDLNPQSLDRYGAAYIMARAHLHAGQYDRAIERAREALDLRPTFHHSYVVLAASLALAGREADAKEALARGQSVRPDFIEQWVEWPLYVLDEQKSLVVDGLRKAGWQARPPETGVAELA
jgi:adenylate cyclase